MYAAGKATSSLTAPQCWPWVAGLAPRLHRRHASALQTSPVIWTLWWMLVTLLWCVAPTSPALQGHGPWELIQNHRELTQYQFGQCCSEETAHSVSRCARTETSHGGVYSARGGPSRSSHLTQDLLGHRRLAWRQNLLICLSSTRLGKTVGTLLCCWDGWQYSPKWREKGA